MKDKTMKPLESYYYSIGCDLKNIFMKSILKVSVEKLLCEVMKKQNLVKVLIKINEREKTKTQKPSVAFCYCTCVSGFSQNFLFGQATSLKKFLKYPSAMHFFSWMKIDYWEKYNVGIQ